MARPLPRTRGVTASRTGDHGREHPAGRLLRSALCPRSRPSLPDQTRDEGPRAYRIYRRQPSSSTLRAPVAMYDGEEAVEAVIATGSDNAVRHFRTRYAGIPTPAAGTPPVGRRALGRGDARTVGRLGRRHPCLRGYGVPQRIDDLATARI